MRFYCDYHIHSKYARATSKQMNLVSLHKWAQLKGIRLLGTGDFTHPRYFEEIKEQLEPAESGFFKLKEKYAAQVESEIPQPCKNGMRFILSVEISSIYKKNDKVRKVHSIVMFPSIDDAAQFNSRLQKIGNIASDGRPILGLDAKELLKIALDINEKALFVPAHIWTPWFSVFGSKSGFNSLEECFEELTPHIFAIETGLSSDPPMNWALSNLDNMTITSNSDAHSPMKLGREANILDCEFSYDGFYDALKFGKDKGFVGTIEFFPEEGKYHVDGHRKCSKSMEPDETRKHAGLCPVCGKPVTVGVLNRVNEIADRKLGDHGAKNALYFQKMIPLNEIIAESFKTGVASKKVLAEYFKMITQIGPELEILCSIPLEEIARHAPAMVVEGIKRVREGNVSIAPGYDGEYGKIKIFSKAEIDKKTGAMEQEVLF